MKRIYFDYAATTPMNEAVVDYMAEAMKAYHGNPSSIHAEGRRARAAIEKARKTVAQLLEASVGEIFFTSGGTESNNMILKCAVRDLEVQRIISTKTEHHAVLHPLELLDRNGAVEVTYLSQDEKGRIDLEELRTLLKDTNKKTLVSLMHANNEIGTMTDMEAVGDLCEEYDALFHSDTTQTVGYFPFNLSNSKIHFLTGAAHKFYGPKGVGFAYINGNNTIKPFIDGGAQERNMRAGTENLYGILGMAKALELAYETLPERREKMLALRSYLVERLSKEFEDVQVNTPLDTLNHYKILSVSFPPSKKSDLILLNLDIAGISVSGGSACSSGADQGSHVLGALHGDSERKTVRFSFSHMNTQEEIDYLIDALKKILC